jgi:hypothetical protein
LASQAETFGLDQAYQPRLDSVLARKALPHHLTQVILKSTSASLDPPQADASDPRLPKQSGSQQSPSTPSEITYDVFISYNEADQAWVREELLPRLEGAGLQVAIDYRDFIVGMPRLENIEQAVEHSHRTIVVLTPAWVASDWNAFESLLLGAVDPAARQRKLLPALLKPCPELPPRLAALEKVDLTNERYVAQQLQRLVRDIEDVIPVPPPWQTPDEGLRNLKNWRRWLSRYRRELRRSLGAIFIGSLLVTMLLQLPPFQPRQVWTALSPRLSEATQLAYLDNVLLVGGKNIAYGCDQVEQGIWRGLNGGEHWQVIHAPLQFNHPEQGCLLADIEGFAVSSTQGQRVYAATSDVGLLRSDDAGQTWQHTSQVDPSNPPVIAVTIDSTNADRVFIATEIGGLFRSDNGGQQWERLDRQDDGVRCNQGQPLTRTLVVGALLATPDYLVVGTADPFYLNPELHVPVGLYLSADGGLCWQPIDASEYRQYLDLTYASTSAGDYILALVRDWDKEYEEETNRIWRLNLTYSEPKPQLLWTYRHAIDDLIAVGEYWYIATPLGEIVRGDLNSPAQEVQSFPVLPCFVLICDVAFASEGDSASPLLLANGRVFRLQEGAWWQWLWP